MFHDCAQSLKNLHIVANASWFVSSLKLVAETFFTLLWRRLLVQQVLIVAFSVPDTCKAGEIPDVKFFEVHYRSRIQGNCRSCKWRWYLWMEERWTEIFCRSFCKGIYLQNISSWPTLIASEHGNVDKTFVPCRIRWLGPMILMSMLCMILFWQRGKRSSTECRQKLKEESENGQANPWHEISEFARLHDGGVWRVQEASRFCMNANIFVFRVTLWTSGNYFVNGSHCGLTTPELV